MKFGIGLVYNRLALDRLSEIAVRAEQLGFESISVGDHLVFPASFESEYPYPAGGESSIRPDSRWLDPFAVLSHVAAVTSALRLVICVYILPLRNPLLTARAAATVDVLSNGRLELGVGVGWMREEFDLAGEDFRNRASRTDEAIAVLRALWTQPEPSFTGSHYTFGPVRFEPKPVQKPHPPIGVGGESPAALRRAALLGDGWFPTPHSPAEIAPMIDGLRRLRAESSRADLPFTITMIAGPSVAREHVGKYEEAGVDRLIVYPWQTTEDPLVSLEREASELGLR